MDTELTDVDISSAVSRVSYIVYLFINSWNS